LNNSIAEFVEAIWKKARLSQEFSGSLKQALLFSDSTSDFRKSRLASLPGFCCQSAGGDPALAGPVSAAWLIFNRAARIMDSVQDGDIPEPWWEQQGPGFALNVASAFFFTASKILAGLEIHGISSRSADAIRNTFSSLLLQMTEGQHLDLTASRVRLEEYWRIVDLKSGQFFAIGSRSGAELVLNGGERLDGFEAYGREIGLLIQLLDDLEEFQVTPESESFFLDLSENKPSLPLAYAFTILPEGEQRFLSDYVKHAKFDSKAAQSVIDLLDRIGAPSYMSTEIARHANLALQALEQASPNEAARGILEDLVKTLIS
jgi:geranylgeranyl pyrophosphate synthase